MSGRRIDASSSPRRGASLTAVLGMVAALLTVMVASTSPAHAQGLPATCDPGSIFNLGQSGILYETTTPSNGAPVSTMIADFTPAGATQTTTNALGVAADASTFYAAQMSTGAAPGGNTMTVFRMAGANGNVTLTTGVPSVPNSTFVMGAVNPDTGIYYFATYANLAVPGMTGTPRVLRILGFDPSTNQGIGEVARIVVDPSGTSTIDGDFAFDSEGNLYVLIGRRSGQGPAPNTGISTVVKVPAAKLPEGQVATPVTLASEPLARITTPPEAYFNGIAFAADGNLYAQSTLAGPPLTARIWTINPNTGAIGDLNPPNQTFNPPLETGGNPNDLAGCSFPGTVTVQKVLPDGRANPLDQFTTTITQENNANAHWEATTEGPVDGPQSPSAFTIGLPGTTYDISEALDPDSSSTSPAAYDRHLPPTCHNNTTNQDVPVTGPNPDGSFSLVFPGPTGVQGAVVLCTFTNTPAVPQLTLRKALADSGRLDDADQFIMRIHDANGPVGTGNATTAGTGSTVTDGTGIQTVADASNGPFRMDERMTDTSVSALDDYQHLIVCTDLNRVQTTGLPNHTFVDSDQPILVTPQPGSNIDCVMTNSRHEPVLGLTKVFGSDRVRPDDQFRVAIVGPNGEVPPIPGHDPTTAGQNQDVTEGTGTTGFVTVTTGSTYSLTESPVGTTSPALYTSTVTCEDENGFTTNLPDNTPLSDNPTVTPVAGSWISCTITNTGVPPTIQLSKALNGTRVNPGDQWTMQLLHDDTVVGTPGTATTTGTGGSIDTGTGVTSEAPAIAGDSYILQEVAAGSTVTGQYTQSLTCQDTNGVQDPATLPTADSLPAEIVPQLGAAIVCTNTNTPDPPTISIAKTSTATRIAPGTQVPYTLTVTNTGTSPATGVVVTDTLPTGLTFVSSTVVLQTSEGPVPLAGCSAAGQNITCDLGYVNAGESVTIDVVTQAATPFPGTDVQPDGTVINAANVTSPGTNCPPDSTDPECNAELPLPVLPTLKITKTSTATRIAAGATVPYTLTVRNTGPVPATTVVVTDTLPVGLTFVSSTPACSASGQVVTCDLGDIAVGADVVIQMTTRAANPFPTTAINSAGMVVNAANVSSEGTNCPPGSTDPACNAQLPLPVPKSTPTVSTVTSRSQVTPGTAISDQITVAGLEGSTTAVAELFGPFSSRGSAKCKKSFQVAKKKLTVINGTNRTPTVRLRAPGFYTWRVTLQANARNASATHACGQAVETTMVAKPPYTGPAIKGGFTGTLGPADRAAPAPRSAPTMIRMASIRMNAPVVPEPIRGNHMVLPPFRKVGWLKNSDSFGDKIGNVVVGAHVSSRTDVPGAMFRLKNAKKGDLVTATKGGKTYKYKVTGKVIFSRHHKIPQKYFSTTGKPRLIMVSCVHKKRLPRGRFTYTKYIIVVAKQVS
jgi:uncharacterized repeat protein (TIGR01451 family)